MYRGWTQTDYQNKHCNISQNEEETQDDRGRDGGTNFILRIKEQETCLNLQEHDDSDDDDDEEEGEEVDDDDIYMCIYIYIYICTDEIFKTLTWNNKTRQRKESMHQTKTGAQNIVKEIKQYQEKWLQHVQRMDTNRLPKETLQYKPKRRRNIGRPRKRWRDQRHLEDQGTG